MHWYGVKCVLRPFYIIPLQLCLQNKRIVDQPPFTLFFANLYHLISSGNGKGLIWINVSTLELQELDNGSYLCRYAQCSRDPRHTLCHIPHHHRSGVYRSGRQKGNARGTFLGIPISELEYAQLSIIHVHQLPCCLWDPLAYVCGMDKSKLWAMHKGSNNLLLEAVTEWDMTRKGVRNLTGSRVKKK